MNNYQKYGLLLAIIFSILLHLIFIKIFYFKIFKYDNQKTSDDMEITIVNQNNLSSPNIKEYLPDNTQPKLKEPLVISNKLENNKNDSNKKIINPEVSNPSVSKLIDTSKILSDITNIDLSTEKGKSMYALALAARMADKEIRVTLPFCSGKRPLVNTINL